MYILIYVYVHISIYAAVAPRQCTPCCGTSIVVIQRARAKDATDPDKKRMYKHICVHVCEHMCIYYQHLQAFLSCTLYASWPYSKARCKIQAC